MRNLRIFIIAFTVQFLIPSEILSQVKEVGVNVGYGNTVIDEYGHDRTFISPFDVEFMYLYRFGVCYYYTPVNSRFSIRTGLDYDVKSENESKLKYFRSPLGLEFEFGKELQLIAGGGLFLSYLFATSGTSLLADSENSFEKLQLGWFANAGVGFQLSPNYKLSIKYHYNADISKMFENSLSSPGGAHYTIDAKGYDGIIILCMKYKLIKD